MANVLIVDNPPPVGYSYCTPVGMTRESLTHSNSVQDPLEKEPAVVLGTTLM